MNTDDPTLLLFREMLTKNLPPQLRDFLTTMFTTVMQERKDAEHKDTEYNAVCLCGLALTDELSSSTQPEQTAGENTHHIQSSPSLGKK